GHQAVVVGEVGGGPDAVGGSSAEHELLARLFARWHLGRARGRRDDPFGEVVDRDEVRRAMVDDKVAAGREPVHDQPTLGHAPPRTGALAGILEVADAAWAVLGDL